MQRNQTIAKKQVVSARPAELQTLNFKVPDDFKRAFKVYAAGQGITMLELLKEGFELSKSKREGSK